jgi:DNA polymerase-3 subunit delta
VRYQNLKSFEKHIASAAPNLLCRLYLVAIGDDFERNKALDLILKHLPSQPTRFSGVDCNLKDVLDAMQSESLFGEPVLVVDEVEKLSKKQLETLAGALTSFVGYLLFGARSKTAALSQAVEKEGVILDLLEEKPWDKERRLSEQLIERAKQAGKKLLPDAASLLLERLGVDPALLESEIDKLICYVGERSAISREDILSISPASRTSTFWQTAEEVVWEGGDFPSVDSAAFHALIPALRSQLHLGLTLATLIEERTPSDEWSRYLPKLWPKTLEKRSSQAARLGSVYFRKGLEKLFELELQSRSNSTQYRALLDLFRAGFLTNRNAPSA